MLVEALSITCITYAIIEPNIEFVNTTHSDWVTVLCKCVRGDMCRSRGCKECRRSKSVHNGLRRRNRFQQFKRLQHCGSDRIWIRCRGGGINWACGEFISFSQFKGIREQTYGSSSCLLSSFFFFFFSTPTFMLLLARERITLYVLPTYLNSA